MSKKDSKQAAHNERELQQTAEEAGRLDLKVKALVLELEEKKAKIRQLIPAGTYPNIDLGNGMILKTEPNRMLDKVAAEKRYGKKVMELQVTAEAAKRYLTPEQYEELMKVTTTKLSFVAAKA